MLAACQLQTLIAANSGLDEEARRQYDIRFHSAAFNNHLVKQIFLLQINFQVLPVKAGADERVKGISGERFADFC